MTLNILLTEPGLRLSRAKKRVGAAYRYYGNRGQDKTEYHQSIAALL
jgi:hypothetical protein